MDNQRFDITGEGEEQLGHALRIAFAQHSKVVGWKVDDRGDGGGPRLIFAWMECEGFTPFPSSVSSQRAVSVISDWLGEADYGEEPDHDGSNDRGWRVFTNAWGHVEPYHSPAFLAVEPAWAMYGK